MQLNSLEARIGRPLEMDEVAELEMFYRGRALRGIVNDPGWDEVVSMLKEIATKATDALRATKPWQREDVLSAHAVAFAAEQICDQFLRDVQLAVDQETPQVMLEISRRSGIPAEV